MKSYKDKINSTSVYIAKLQNQLLNPSARHDTPTKLAEYKKWVSREIVKAQNLIQKLSL